MIDTPIERGAMSDETTIVVTGIPAVIVAPSRFARLSSLHRSLDHLSIAVLTNVRRDSGRIAVS
jgi:hypothetical protein